DSSPRSTLVPYTTLFRSPDDGEHRGDEVEIDAEGLEEEALEEGADAADLKEDLDEGDEPEGRDAVVDEADDGGEGVPHVAEADQDRKSTRLNSSHVKISY